MLSAFDRLYMNIVSCFCHKKHALFFICTILSLVSRCLSIGDVIWAVNCGGDAHTDVHGIRYETDPLKVGISSDYGKTLLVSRVVPQDQILYQTERYHMSTFGYDIPLTDDGEYVLVLKFCEVWFTSPNQKVRTQNNQNRYYNYALFLTPGQFIPPQQEEISPLQQGCTRMLASVIT